MASSSVQTMRLPDFCCIGTYKAATTWLFDALDARDDVFIPDVKEIHFFNVRGGHDAFRDKGIAWYSALFASAPDGAVLGDVTPGYLASPVAAERIAATLPDARLIVFLRNPAERAWSHYWYREGMVQKQPAFEDIAAAQPFPQEGIIDQGFYARHLRRWYQHVPPERMMVVLFEDVQKSPLDVYTNVCNFIGLDPSVVPAVIFDRSNAARRFRSPRLYNMKQRIARFIYLSGADPLRRAIKRTGIPGLLNRMNRAPVDNPQMSIGMRRRLVEIYRTDIEELSRIIGRDLSAWLQ
jgi:hypothetical protein